MNNLEKYVSYAQPVVKTINEHHNEFYRLEYYNLGAEDLFAEDGLVEFQTQDKNRPEHFNSVTKLKRFQTLVGISALWKLYVYASVVVLGYMAIVFFLI